MNKSIHRVLLALSVTIILLTNGCSAAITPEANPSQPENVSQPANTPETSVPPEQLVIEPHTIAEVERLAGFDIKEPAYLPDGVSFDFATYQATPPLNVTLHFQLTHPTYGDMGAFFQIMQTPQTEASPDTTSCGEAKEGCEVLQIGARPVVYRLNAGGTEGLDWYSEGFVFRLLRTAGEPNKVYKDELIKVVESMQ